MVLARVLAPQERSSVSAGASVGESKLMNQALRKAATRARWWSIRAWSIACRPRCVCGSA